MKKFYSFVLLVLSAVAMCTSCSERAELYGDGEKTAAFDVSLARDAFMRDYGAAVHTRSEDGRGHRHYTLADTEFTPLWDRAVASENEHILSLDVPVYAVTACFGSDNGGEDMYMATQKLVFIQRKTDGEIFSYLLTLCPDERCRNRCSDIGRIYVHAGDKSRFSGVAIYTDLAGNLVSVHRYSQGVVASEAYVVNTRAAETGDDSGVGSVLGVTHIYLSSTPLTRGGGGGATFEGLCEECMTYPCVCDNDMNRYCVWCGMYKPCGCMIDICYKCMVHPCICNYELDKVCDKCGNFVCTCNPCPRCGSLVCGGCGPDDGEKDVNNCAYCGKKCGHSCSAYCPTCHNLKSECSVHYCNKCGNVNSGCICK